MNIKIGIIIQICFQICSLTTKMSLNRNYNSDLGNFFVKTLGLFLIPKAPAPPLAIQVYDNHLYLKGKAYASNVTGVYDLGTVVSNEWIDIVINVKWALGSTGALECWRNGVKLVDEEDISTNSAGGSYLKLGINKWNWAPPFDPEESEVEQRVFYIDEFRIGDENATYNDVAPEELLPVLRRGVPAVESGVTRFSLGQNYPNPFGVSTTIRYELPKSSLVNLSVFDLNGRVVKVLVNGTRSAGVHTIRLDGGGLAKGVYYYKMRVGGEQVVKKMVVQ